MTSQEARSQFAEMVSRSEAEIELDRAAFLIAAEEYPLLPIDDYLAQLDRLAEAARKRMSVADYAHPTDRLLSLCAFLFQDYCLSGNAENYYDARNSFLNDVLDRRAGIPITLSVILMEVARRLNLTLWGVGLPGHFIVKYFDTSEAEVREILLDPFKGGRVLDEDDCRQLVEEVYQGKVAFDGSYLSVISKRQILIRMLQNLKRVYGQTAAHFKTLGVIERLLLLAPGAIYEIRDRGITHLTLHNFIQARADLEHYLKILPQAEDAEKIKQYLTQLRQRQAQLN